MENQRDAKPDATAARQALAAVADLEAATAWRPARWVMILIAAVLGASVTAFAWEWFWWGFGLLAALAVLAFVLRRKIADPYIRQRPWQELEKQESPATRETWISAGFGLWVPMTILIPADLRWLGALVGCAAGSHAYYAIKCFGTR
ncbi:hypothetical protein [Corynebacterium halotolerans]|uniref:hypothetical protein n=1 Tax=Corynebacterium halotolerans TaxID=225326 RepID=UPI003CF56F2F